MHHRQAHRETVTRRKGRRDRAESVTRLTPLGPENPYGLRFPLPNEYDESGFQLVPQLIGQDTGRGVRSAQRGGHPQDERASGARSSGSSGDAGINRYSGPGLRHRDGPGTAGAGHLGNQLSTDPPVNRRSAAISGRCSLSRMRGAKDEPSLPCAGHAASGGAQDPALQHRI